MGSKEGAYISEAALEANRRQMERGDALRELAAWIRWTDEDAKRHGNGLTPESMEMSG